MAYTVLARKYRSRTFDEIVGQDAIATTLKNAVASGRVHHGYLFTGTRGVGKTSMARILAKSLNCLSVDAPTPDPCCECEACRMIAEGEDIDVVEIDAASNTGVDNIRDLRSNTVFRPARSRFKVYIIDEVHMLSTGAFNALLKTLEEPPEHVKFILATTEAHRVPATIQSRCQQFDFRTIASKTIAEQLWSIVQAESIEADDAVIRRVSRLAAGSMRDALSLLDQLMAFGGTSLTAEILEEVLPTAHDELVYELVGHLGEQNAAGALLCVERCLSSGHTVERLCDALIEHLRLLMLLRVCGEDSELVDVASQVKDRLVKQAAVFDGATYVYLISLCEEVRRSVKQSRSGRALLDATVVRLACAEHFSEVGAILARLEGNAPPAPSPTLQRKKKEVDKPQAATAPRRASLPPPGAAEPPVTVSSQPKSAFAPAVSISSADKQKVLTDPFVRRLMELSGGSLTGVRLGSRPEPEDSNRAEGDADVELEV